MTDVCCSRILSVIVGILYRLFFFFQAEDGIRDLVRSRGLGDVYKRQAIARDDDTTFGVLQSRLHEIWALRLGTSLEDRPLSLIHI